MFTRLLRIALGYFGACSVGGVAVAILMNYVEPTPRFMWTCLFFFVTALVVCSPSFLAGRYYLGWGNYLTVKQHVILWIIAGSLPPLFFGGNKMMALGAIMSLVLVPAGAFAGLVARFIEGGQVEST